MNKMRVELKVGMFVLVGLVLLGILLLQFGKGASLFRPTYTLFLTTQSVGGLRENAAVLMSGVQIGTVSQIRLSPDGKFVTVTLKIHENFTVRDDAQFLIKQSGFLGDNYVEIDPGESAGNPFTNNAAAIAEEPFDLQEVARTAVGFIERVDQTAAELNDAISDVRRLLLNEQTLTNLSSAAITMRLASERALGTMASIDTLFSTNAASVSESATNLMLASEELTRFALSLNSLLATNQESVARSVQNVETSTVILNNILDDVQAGRGLAGTLLKDEQVAAHLSDLVENLSITSSNLNRFGLWRGVLFPKRPKEQPEEGRRLTAPGSPFN